MKLTALTATLLLFVSSVASAQAPAMQIQRLELKPTPAQVTPSQLQLNTEEAQLKRRIADLERENEALKKQVAAYAELGGSNVHAYCPVGSPHLSRNTAGAESNCGQGGYNCDPVSGLCRTSCSNGDHCSAGFDCSGNQCKTMAQIKAETGQE